MVVVGCTLMNWFETMYACYEFWACCVLNTAVHPKINARDIFYPEAKVDWSRSKYETCWDRFKLGYRNLLPLTISGLPLSPFLGGEPGGVVAGVETAFDGHGGSDSSIWMLTKSFSWARSRSMITVLCLAVILAKVRMRRCIRSLHSNIERYNSCLNIK